MSDWRKAMRIEHYEKYDALSNKIGIERLIPVVLRVATKECIEEALKEDRSMNNIPLKYWDGGHESVRMLLKGTGIEWWSLCSSVCVLKHVARHYVAGKEFDPEEE